MDEKALERDERLGRFLLRISDWWERQKTRISNYIFLHLLRRENPSKVVERIQEECQSWNSKFAGRCEACNHNDLISHYWMNNPTHGFKCFECIRCRHKQPTDNSKRVYYEIWSKTRIITNKNGTRYALLTIKEQGWLAAIGLAASLIYLVNNLNNLLPKSN